MNLNARIHLITQSTAGGVGRATADILVSAFFLQDRLESSIAKNNAGCKEAVDDGDENLYYKRCKMIGRISWRRGFGVTRRGPSGGVKEWDDSRILFQRGTSKAPTESMCPGLSTGSHDSGRGLKLNRLSRLDGEGLLDTWRLENVSRDETRLRDIMVPWELGG